MLVQEPENVVEVDEVRVCGLSLGVVRVELLAGGEREVAFELSGAAARNLALKLFVGSHRLRVDADGNLAIVVAEIES